MATFNFEVTDADAERQAIKYKLNSDGSLTPVTVMEGEPVPPGSSMPTVNVEIMDTDGQSHLVKYRQNPDETLTPLTALAEGATIPGPPGPEGSQGPPGPQGETGPQGADSTVPGPKGDRGDLGPQGEQGVQGDTGPQGEQGPQGIQGEKGETGPQGEQGPQGADSTVPGPPNALAIGDVTSGEEASATITGESPEQILNLVLPAGPQGEVGPQGDTGVQGEIGPQGDQGPQGEPGPQGESGPQGDTGPQGDAGPQGDQGGQGEKGDEGDSAYDVAVQNGFTGTEPEWLVSLKGEQGEQGPQGEVGPQGADSTVPGPVGLQGDTGEQGPKGDKGDKGDIGDVGPEGPQGPAGTGLPAGGAVGQIPIKSSTTDGETHWGSVDTEQLADGAVTPAKTVRLSFRTVTASTTLALTDVDGVVEVDSASALTITVPTNAAVPFPLGTVIEIIGWGTGTVNVSPQGGVTLRSPDGASSIAAQYGSAFLRKRALDEWHLTGDLE